MGLHYLRRRVLTSCVATALLAGCGGSGDQFGAPNTVQQGTMHRGSGTSSGLLYVVTDSSEAYVIDYPTGSPVGRIQYPAFTGTGDCSDTSGNVYITAGGGGSSSHPGYVYEFAHGGTTPIKTISDKVYTPETCSVDSITGNLAVAASARPNCYPAGGEVDIYTDGQGAPTAYTSSGFQCYTAAAYDNQGNLFVGGLGSNDAFKLAELKRGASSLMTISIDKSVLCRGSGCGDLLQWDGTHLAITKPSTEKSSPIVYRVAVTGSSGKVTGTVTFKGKWGRFGGESSWIGNGQIIMVYHPSGSLGIWKYPAGGKLMRVLTKGLGFRKPGMTMSFGS